MPKTLIKSRLHSYKQKAKVKQEINITKSNLPPKLQSFKQKLLSGSGFVEYIKEYFILFYINEFRRFSNFRQWTLWY